MGAYQEKIRFSKTDIEGIGVEDDKSCSSCTASGDCNRIRWTPKRLARPHFFSFETWNTYSLSLRQTQHHVFSFLRQMSHGSGISNILWSTVQLRLHLHSFLTWPLKTSFQATNSAIHLVSAVLLYCVAALHSLLHLSYVQHQYHMFNAARFSVSSDGAWRPLTTFEAASICLGR